MIYRNDSKKNDVENDQSRNMAPRSANDSSDTDATHVSLKPPANSPSLPGKTYREVSTLFIRTLGNTKFVTLLFTVRQPRAKCSFL